MEVIKEPDRTILISSKVRGDVLIRDAGLTIVSPLQSTALIQDIRHPTEVVVAPPREVVSSAKIIFERSSPGSGGSASATHSVLDETGFGVVDFLPSERSESFTWKVQVDDPVKMERVSFLVSSTHNGMEGIPPSEVQWVVFGKIRFGAVPVATRVQLSGPSAAPEVQLVLQSGAGFKVSVWRIQGLG